MRRFHSYGPVDYDEHFCIRRNELIEQCTKQLIGNPDKGGHFFTIWAPRQTGKTWLMRQAIEKIHALYDDKFIIGKMSCQGLIFKENPAEDDFLTKVPKLMLDGFDADVDAPGTWEEWVMFFHKRKGMFKKQVVLFIDEFDSLPPQVIDKVITQFRDMYLNRNDYILHGLGLIGIRAVLGVESLRGSPFNIQRSLHVPNFTEQEVEDLYRQYQEESGQQIDPAVVKNVYDVTRGQPGLVSWFGELITETYNTQRDKPIDEQLWNNVYRLSCTVEWNNSVLNLIKKAKGEYRSHILELFARSDVLFTLDADWCSYIYLHGIIDRQTVTESGGLKKEICRFSSPYIQLRIYNALTYDLVGERLPILALDPLDDLADVFEVPELNIPALMQRYKDYLKRLKAKGLNPWKDQPRRTDMHLTEAVGHFHLYAWLQNAVGKPCTISPEFPTGNGKVDLHLRCAGKEGIIEVKSFIDSAQMKNSKHQAAEYAIKMGLKTVTLVLFAPIEDDSVLQKLSGEDKVGGVSVVTIAIGCFF